jgi:hypothetical protein
MNADGGGEVRSLGETEKTKKYSYI